MDVPFLLGALVTPTLLKEKLEEKGFTQVAVAEERPAGWPLGQDGDYYVSVAWNRGPQIFDLPDAVVAHRKVA